MLRTSTIIALGLCVALTLSGCRRRPMTRGPANTQNSSVPGNAPRAAVSATRTVYIEPDAGFGWLYAMINNAQHNIDMTMYELVDTTFSGDLVAACGRGVRVRVILDQSLEKNSNTDAFNQLNSAGPNCSAAWSNPQFQATHQKSIVIDGAQAVIMTLNLTSRYYTSTRDFAVVEDDPADIKAIETTFTNDYGSTTDFTYQPSLGDALIWSPTIAQLSLANIIDSAKDTLLIENEEMGASAIVEPLVEACKRGVAVEIAMTDTNASYHANYIALEQAGCGVHIGANDASTLYIHAKAIIGDLGTPGEVGYVGSINFSSASLNQNRELGLFVYDANLLSQISSTIAQDYAHFPAFK